MAETRPELWADALIKEASELRKLAVEETGSDRSKLLAQATLNATMAVFYELRRANLNTEAHTAALTKHTHWMAEHHGALSRHADALKTQAQAMDHHAGALHDFERASRRLEH